MSMSPKKYIEAKHSSQSFMNLLGDTQLANLGQILLKLAHQTVGLHIEWSLLMTRLNMAGYAFAIEYFSSRDNNRIFNVLQY